MVLTSVEASQRVLWELYENSSLCNSKDKFTGLRTSSRTDLRTSSRTGLRTGLSTGLRTGIVK